MRIGSCRWECQINKQPWRGRVEQDAKHGGERQSGGGREEEGIVQRVKRGRIMELGDQVVTGWSTL